MAVEGGQEVLPPLKVLFRHTVPAGGEASHTFTLGTLVTDWDSKVGVTSRHLCILVYAASEDAVANRSLMCRINADTGWNYSQMYISGVDSTAGAGGFNGWDYAGLGEIPGTNYADAFGGGFILIPHAFNTIGHKSILSLMGPAEERVTAILNRWANTAAITSILLYPSAGDFIENSILYLCVVDERYQIGESILSGADGTFSFPNIEARDGDLVSIGYLRSDRVATGDNIKHEINTDAVAANYYRQRLYGVETPAIAASTGNNNNIGVSAAFNATANVFGALLAFYPHFAGALNDPNALALSGFHEDTPDAEIWVTSARRNNIEPINRIDYKPLNGTNFKDGSMMSLYRSPKNLIGRHICMVSEPSVTFDNLDRFKKDFEALEIRVYARTDVGANWDNVLIALNDDTTAANYDKQRLYGQGAGVTAVRSAAERALMTIIGNWEGGNEFGGGSALILQYAGTVGHKHILGCFGMTENEVTIQSQRWENTNPITKITLTPENGTNFLVDSIFEIYGIVPMDDTIRPTKKLKAGQSLIRRLKAFRS